MPPETVTQTPSYSSVAWAALWAAGELTLLVVVAGGLSVAWAALMYWLQVRRRHVFWSAPLVSMACYAVWLAVRYPGEALSAQFAHPRLWFQVLSGVVVFGSALGAAIFAAAVRYAWESMRPSDAGVKAASEFLTHPAATTPYPSFREGFVAPWDGVVYLAWRPTLVRYGVIPLVLNLLITGLVLVVLVLTGTALAVYVHPWFSAGWGGRTLEVAAVVALSLVLLGVTLIAWKLLEGVLCGYFYGELARRVEIELGVAEGEIREIPISQQAIDTAREVFWLVTVNGGFLLAHLIPFIGSIVAVVGSLYYDWRIFGLEYFSYPLNLRGRRWPERREFAHRHRSHTLGLGSAVFLVNFARC
jgi:uncharacterized protein involved in cysteine biosynthesis